MPSHDLRLPSLDALIAFASAARLGSFERAAEDLHLTASAVGKRIATLEDRLGLTLFERGPRALVLTAAGREYLAPVEQALALLAAMPQHRRTAPTRQRLRLCAPPTFARQVLVPRLHAFAAAQPQIDLEVVLSTPHLDTPAPAADVEVRHAVRGLGAPLLRDLVLPLASPPLMARLPALTTPAAMLAHAPLLRTPIEPWAPWLAAMALPTREPETGPRYVDLGLVLEAAAAGQGVALARPALALPWLRNGTLVAVAPAAQADRWALASSASYQWIVHVTGPAATALGDWLHACCRETEAEALAAVGLQG
ncbi:MAG: LysR family transcriptional regulator [Rubrivivax sp.]|jgi:DNA-binding transcriptional LysR family regulator|nr:LysR family transcriptional regulator [Rubrivivax sp.]